MAFIADKRFNLGPDILLPFRLLGSLFLDNVGVFTSFLQVGGCAESTGGEKLLNGGEGWRKVGRKDVGDVVGEVRARIADCDLGGVASRQVKRRERQSDGSGTNDGEVLKRELHWGEHDGG